MASDPLAGPSHLPAWLDCICEAGGWSDASRLYEFPDGRRMVIPLVRQGFAAAPGQSGLLDVHASFPRGWASGGIVAPGGATTEDVAFALTDLAAAPGLRMLLRPGFSTAATWREASSHGWGSECGPLKMPLATYILDLEGGLEKVWSNRLSSKARSGIRNAQRKADKAKLEIDVGNSPQLLADFYDLYLRWLDRRARERRMPRAVARWRGQRAEPMLRFHTVATALGERCRIWVARLDGTPIASAFAVYHGAIGIGWRAFSDRELAGPLRAHELVQFLAIEHACGIGCRYFDMGESGGAAGLATVKKRFGAKPHAVAEYAFERAPISYVERNLAELRNRIESRALSAHQCHREPS
ncbi:GNAT family N-acetyltransferase [Rhodococcus sp. T7]|uniref:GNAT family N-acetyltransferase n=1 Tax=Rhodococcus sp. T7 TaxID=627444 RepID=UPI00135CDEA1|nr:GNAT family N-acetyltransferase [Rhodococcus sp. T7]